jgi:Cu-Zn family superoxide dismutase
MVWKHVLRNLAAVLAIVAFASGGSVALADRGDDDHHSGTKVFTLDPSTHGNPEGVAYDKDSDAFFVGATGDGTIDRGTLDSPTATVFIPGAEGKSAIGMKVDEGKLYVAGGATGTISVYDIATRQLVASFETGAGGFLNDLVVTNDGDVFVTDSFRPTLWHVTAAQVAAGSGTPEGISVEPEIVYTAGQFNLNGIVALEGGKQLVVVHSFTGQLFRIDLDGSGASGRAIHQIDVEPLTGGDGLLLDRGRLIVVQGNPAKLTFVKLKGDASRGQVVDERTDPTLRGPSTVARARDLYLVVNADFNNSATPFTVSGLPRGADLGPPQ